MPISKGQQRRETPLAKGDKVLGLEWVTILPKNQARKGCSVFNASNAVVFLDFGKGQGAGYMVAVPPGGLWESPFPCTEPLVGKALSAASSVYARDFN